MIIIRPETTDDYQAIYAVNKEAFQGEVEAKLIEDLRKSPGFIPELSLVAVKDKRIVGHILFSQVKIKTKKGEIIALCLGPMAVVPEFQKQGIGSLLVKKGLDACQKLGYDIVILIGHPDYYPRFGFTLARPKGLEVSFKFPVPDEAFMVCELKSGALKDIKGMVEFPSAFDEAM